MEFYTVNDGKLQLLTANRKPQAETSRIWCYDRQAGCWRVDMMIEQGTDEYWIYKRDPEIRYLRNEMVIQTAEGIPYLNPFTVLLFKEKYCRQKDEDDFVRALAGLSSAERLRLTDYLHRFHPGGCDALSFFH